MADKVLKAMNALYQRAITTSTYILRYAKTPISDVDRENGNLVKLKDKDKIIKKLLKNREKCRRQEIEKRNVKRGAKSKIGEQVLVF